MFNFGPDIIQWVKTFYTDVISCVTNNGYASNFFQLQRGVRQGCPLSGILFVMCIEILAKQIKNDPNIQGIRVGAKEIKISQYADDTTVFVQNGKSVEHLIETLKIFELCSGLKINTEKTEAIWLGSWRNRKDALFGFNWPEKPINALGIFFSYDEEANRNLNFEQKLASLEKTLNFWERRKLTLLGRITIIKTLGLSKLIYNCSVLAVPVEIIKKQ